MKRNPLLTQTVAWVSGAIRRCQRARHVGWVFGALLACGPPPADDAASSGWDIPSPAPVCVANNDGKIERSELPMAVGVPARFRIERGEIAVNPAGRVENGVTLWDFSRPSPEAQPLSRLAASELAAHWFAPHFPDAEFAGPLTPEGDLWGPVSIDESGVFLHGSASDASLDEPGTTLLVYDEPVALYPFPMHRGTRLQSEAAASNGLIQGIPVALRDAYDVEVTDVGTLILPELVLENTLRVTLRFSRTLTVGDTKQVSHIFLHECLGEVARIVSPAVSLNENIDDDFPFASEVRRMSL